MTAVGVCGHRHLADPLSVSLALDAVFLHLSEIFPTPFTVFSSLAEGADRLAARKALEYNHSLIVPLPLPETDYISDFSARESRDEFHSLLRVAHEVIMLPTSSSRPESYLAAGRYILDRCRVLIAVWNGQPARGSGGTAQIVEEARQRSLPLAWVQAQRTGDRTGLPAAVIYQHFPSKDQPFRA